MGLIAIGDIHGCAATLEQLILKINPQSDDHLIFIGDYVDRGPDSKGVIDYCLQLEQRVKCTFLRGNHEVLMLDFLAGDTTGLWEMNGGKTTLQSYGTDSILDVPDEHLSFIASTYLFHEEEDFIFVHAGLDINKSVRENVESANEMTFIWERRHLLYSEHPKWEKTVVCGHTPQAVPLIREKLICIDTGCVFSAYGNPGELTAIRLPERIIVSVPYSG